MDGFLMENLIEMDDLGGTPIFGNNRIFTYIYHLKKLNPISGQTNQSLGLYWKYIHY